MSMKNFMPMQGPIASALFMKPGTYLSTIATARSSATISQRTLGCDSHILFPPLLELRHHVGELCQFIRIHMIAVFLLGVIAFADIGCPVHVRLAQERQKLRIRLRVRRRLGHHAKGVHIYHFRAVARSAAGDGNYGNTQLFRQ